PLAPFAPAPADLRERGWNAALTARYRVNRDLIAVLGGELGAQPQLSAGVEGRRAVTRPLPPTDQPPAGEEETDVTTSDPALTDPAVADAVPADAMNPGDAMDTDEAMTAEQPDTEMIGTLTWRAGVLAGRDVLGLTGGVSYATGNGLSVGVDALAGVNTYGVSGSLSAPDLLGDGSTLRLYAAYEPWRTASSPLRAGVNASFSVGSGTLSLDASAGRTVQGQGGFGVRVGYSLPLP
ncbi:hypothetical protein ACS0QO_17930, partial [Deinococcus aquaticus]